MYTSYFGVAKQVSNTVAICTGVPSWYKGGLYQALAPGWDIVMEYKQAVRDKKPIADIIKNYEERYFNEVLFYLDPEEVYNDLKDKILLCYETSEQFCHRHLVAKWIKDNLDIDVPELNTFEEMKVIIAGGRDFNDYEQLETACDFILSKTHKKITIVSGAARGADTLGEQYAMNRGYQIDSHPADWSLGKRAGFVRNEEMAKEADALIAFWDGTSRGTASMIQLAERYGLKVAVENY